MSGTDPTAELRQQPGWWVRLAGEPLDLQALADDVRLSEVEVRRFGDRYYLRADDFQSPSPDGSADVVRRANEILRVLNGAARLAYGNSHEVHVEAATLVARNGHVQNFVHLSATVRGRGRVGSTLTVQGTAGASPPPPRPAATQIADAGLRDADVARALRTIGRDDVAYRDLYNVFEIAQAALGANMFSDGSVSPAEVSRFSHTAQSPSALGDAARHGTEPKTPPLSPMPFSEAEALVHRILRLWLLR